MTTKKKLPRKQDLIPVHKIPEIKEDVYQFLKSAFVIIEWMDQQKDAVHDKIGYTNEKFNIEIKRLKVIKKKEVKKHDTNTISY